MKKSLFVAAFAALAVVSCKKTDVVTTTDGTDTLKKEEVVAPMTTDSPAVKMPDSPAVKIEADKVVIETPAATTTTTKTEAVEVAPAKK